MLPAVPVNELFNTENAEIVLRSAFVDSAKSALGKTEVSTDFRLQKEQLARISEIFRDMLQLGGSDESSGDECPIVQVEEGTAIVEEILRLTARDDVGAYSRLGDMEPRLLVSVWKASDKYKIPDLEFITEIFIAYVDVCMPNWWTDTQITLQETTEQDGRSALLHCVHTGSTAQQNTATRKCCKASRFVSDREVVD